MAYGSLIESGSIRDLTIRPVDLPLEHPLGAKGLAGAAIAGIDMALWDLAARRAGVPLAALLGSGRRRVPAYASLHAMAPDTAAAEAEAALAAGFGAIKVKVGRDDLAADLEVVRALRAVACDGVSLMVDYNQSLSVDGAVARAAALDAEGVAWIEEPTRADDFAGHARIAAAARVPIQLGENWDGAGDLEKSIAARASDLGMPDAMKIGGVSGWREAAALAADAALPLSSHTFPEFSAHLLAATPTAHWLEHLDHVGSILLEPLAVERGEAVVPQRPGAGVEWDEAALRRVMQQ